MGKLTDYWCRILFFPFFSLALRCCFSAFTRSSVDIGTCVYGIFFEGKYFWFLYVMFGVLTMIEVLRTLKISLIWQLLIALFFYWIGLYTNSSFLCLNRFRYYLIYTVLGIVIYHKKEVVRESFWLNAYDLNYDVPFYSVLSSKTI